MKFLYLANVRVPSEKGETLQVMKMCEVFASSKNIHAVELVVPRRVNPIMRRVDPFVYFNIQHRFTIHKLPMIDFMPWRYVFGSFAARLNYWQVARIMAWYARIQDADIIYSREWRTLHFLRKKKNNLIFELHDFREKDVWGYRAIEPSCLAIIVITKTLKEKLIESGIPSEKIIVEPDAVNIAEFDISLTTKDARVNRYLPQDYRLVVYTGQLFDWKGIPTLIEVFSTLQKTRDNFRLVLVGGFEHDVMKIKNQLLEQNITNILVLGHQPYTTVPEYIRASDAVILADSNNFAISREYTSPLKLFQYMAGKKPIIAPKTPALMELLNHENAWLYEPDDSSSMVTSISNALDNPSESEQKVEHAWELVQKYTWKKRAERILNSVLVNLS